MFVKLRRKFVLLNVTMMSLVVMAAFVTIYALTAGNIQRQNQLKLESASSSAMRMLNNLDGNYEEMLVSYLPGEEFPSTFSVLVDENGQMIYHTPVPESYEENLSGLLGQTQGREAGTIEWAGRQYQFAVSAAYIRTTLETEEVAADALVYRLLTVLDTTDTQGTLRLMLWAFVGIGGLVLGAIFAISLFFARRAVAPIEASYRRQKQFVADASHELKTPVAAMEANLSVMASNPQETVDSQRRWMEYMGLELERMGKLIGDLLTLARCDSGELPVVYSLADLSQRVNDVVLAMEAFVYEKGLVLHSQVEEGIELETDGDKFQQVVAILLDNAVKYADDGGSIWIALQESKSQVLLEVTNTGEGIPPEHLPKLFDRFYRVDEARAHHGGHGLGLSIAREIVQQLGGRITVRSQVGDHTTFSVILKK